MYKNKDFIALVNPISENSNVLDIIDILNGGTWCFNGEKIQEQGYVFDHDFVDDTITQDKTFVFTEIDIENIRDNMFVDFSLYICVFTSKNLMRIDKYSSPDIDYIKSRGYYVNSYANRIDILIDIIEDTILSNSNSLESLGEIKPCKRGHLTRYKPSAKYYGKCLKYTICNYNFGGDFCGD